MPLVIPDAVSLSIHGRFLGNEVVNTFAWLVRATSLSTRTQSIESLQDQIKDGWKDNVLPHVSNQYTLTSWTMVDLDVPDGRVWERTYNLSGAQTGQPLPSNVAVRVVKQSERRAGLRMGSFYLGGFTEAATNGNQLDPVGHTNLQNAMDALKEKWTETGTLAIDYDYEPITIHQKAGQVYVSTISSFDVAKSVTHQDRRIKNR